MRKVRVVIGTLIMMSIGLTSCSLPHDERYYRIDKVLTDIDYQNIGTIVHEEVDHGDGIFTPSHKTIYYKDNDSFEKILHKLENAPYSVNEDCTEKLLNFNKKEENHIYCNYYGTTVKANKSKKDQYGSTTQIMITDMSSGKG